MKRKFFGLFTLAIVIACLSVTAFAQRDIRLIVGGYEVYSDVPAVIVNGRTMLPVRAVFEEIGAEVDYDSEKRQVIAKKDGKSVILTIDGDIMDVDGTQVRLDAPAFIKDGRTLVPCAPVRKPSDLL